MYELIMYRRNSNIRTIFMVFQSEVDFGFFISRDTEPNLGMFVYHIPSHYYWYDFTPARVTCTIIHLSGEVHSVQSLDCYADILFVSTFTKTMFSWVDEHFPQGNNRGFNSKHKKFPQPFVL